MRQVKKDLGVCLSRHMLYIHGIFGCDTTSRPYGIGKVATLKKFADSSSFCRHADLFDAFFSVDNIIDAGEKALVELYGGKEGECLNSLWHRRFHEKVSTRGQQIYPHNLPPTSAAVKQHSLRVYLQVKQWQGRDEHLRIEDWGWLYEDGQVLPVTTHLAPAPEYLLKMIRCNCASDCSTARCTYKKHGLDCSLACGQCKATSWPLHRQRRRGGMKPVLPDIKFISRKKIDCREYWKVTCLTLSIGALACINY